MHGLWQKALCAECGEEGYASRTEPRDPDAGPYICEGCEMYRQGYEDGRNHAIMQKTYGLVLKREVRSMMNSRFRSLYSSRFFSTDESLANRPCCSC